MKAHVSIGLTIPTLELPSHRQHDREPPYTSIKHLIDQWSGARRRGLADERRTVRGRILRLFVLDSLAHYSCTVSGSAVTRARRDNDQRGTCARSARSAIGTGGDLIP
eukprot:4940273-Prymnesium_polylepis.1